MTNMFRSVAELLGTRRRRRSAICAERDRLFRLAWSWTHDANAAEDLAQETLARGLAKLDTLKDESRLRVWLTRILVNVHRDWLRRVHPDTGLDTTTLVSSDDPERSAEQAQIVRRTRNAMTELSNEQRQVLTLVDVADLSYADAAKVLDVPVGTVMSRLSRARKRLRELLGRQGIDRADVIPFGRKQ